MFQIASATLANPIPEALRQHAERRLRFATDRFTQQIRNINLRLTDINGPRGGVDKLCRLTATLRQGRIVVTEARSATYFGAITAAARRLQQLLSRVTKHSVGRQQ